MTGSTGEVQISLWINCKGAVDIQLEEENISFLPLPNWHETQTTLLLKPLEDTCNWNLFKTRETTSQRGGFYS